MKLVTRFLTATFIAALMLGGRAEAQSTSTWANSNVAGTPASPRDWFTGGPNTQGTWLGGNPASNSASTIQFFENTTTALTNTAAPSSQTVNLNNGGSAFELRTLTLSGLGSATTNANLTMTLSGDALSFIAATGTINLNALNAASTITYNVNNDIQLGTASSASVLTIGGTGTGTFVLGGIISELQAGGGSLVKNGVSTVTLAGANTYTGTTTLNAGGLNLDSATAIGTGPLVIAGGTLGNTSGAAITLSSNNAQTWSGNFTFAAMNDLNLGTGAVSLGAATRTVTVSSNALTVGGAISGAGGLTKIGAGTLSLGGANTYTGATSATDGGLVLDYGTQDNSKLSNTAALTLGGVGVVLKGGSHTETVLSTALSAGGSTISRDGGTSGMQLNAVTRSSQGTLVFGEASIATTDTLNVNGILGGWATIGENWAVNGTNGADGAITSLASYTGALPVATGANNGNYTLTGDQTQAGAVAANTVKITNTGNSETLSLDANNLTITAASVTSLGGILYAGGADGSYTIGSTTGRIQPSTANQELIFQTTSGTLAVNALVGASSASSPVTKNGAGTLVLGAANNFTGAVRVNGGTLRLTNATGAGTTAGGITVQRGATLELANAIAVGAEALSITGTGVAGGGALRNIASNTSSYAGLITIGTGGASIASDSGGVLTLTRVSTAVGNDVTFGGAGDTTFGPTNGVEGAGGVVKVGAGRLTLPSAGNFTGALRVNEGAVRLANATGAGGVSGGITVQNGAALELTNSISIGAEALTLDGAGISSGGALRNIGGTNTYAGLVTLGGNTRINSDAGTLNLSNVGTITGSGFGLTIGGEGNTSISSIIGTGAGTLTKDGAGILTLSGTNTYSGNTTVQDGILLFTGTHAKATGTVTAEAAGSIGLRVGGANSYTSANVAALFGNTLSGFSMNATSGVAVDTTTTGTVSDALAGNRAFTKLGNGTLTLSGTNTYTGTTTLNSGTLSISSDANISGTNSALVFKGGTLQITGTTLTSLNPNRPTTFSSGSTVGFDIGRAAANTFAVSQVLNQGTGGLTKTGTGTLSLDAANTYTGVTTVTAGVLLLNDANALPGGIGATGGTSNLTFNGGVLGLTGDFTRGLGAAGTATAVTLTGKGGWAAFGADRTVNLGGNATPSTITWATASTGFNSQGLLLGSTAATHTVELVNPIDLGSASRSVEVGNGAATIDAKISGNLTGSGTLTVSGGGTLLLSGTNSFAGLSTSNTVIVNSASALGSGTVTLLYGPIVGLASPTSLTVANPMILASNEYQFRLGHAAATGNIVLSGPVQVTGRRVYNNAGDAGLTLIGLSSVDITGTITGAASTGSGGNRTLFGFDVASGKSLRFGADNSSWLTDKALTNSGTYIIGHAKALGSGLIYLGLNNGTTQDSVVMSEVDLTGANALTNNIILGRIGTSSERNVVIFAGTNSIELAGTVETINFRSITNNISGGGSLILSNTFNATDTIFGPSGKTNYLRGTGNTTFTGPIIGSGTTPFSMNIQNTGITTFSGTNTYSGGTTLNAGVLVLSTTAAISGTTARPYTVSAAATLAAGFALDQALLDRVATNAAGVVALGTNSANNLNVTSLNSVSLGAVGSGTQAYSGTLTQTGTYRLGGGGGTLDFQSALTGANALIVGGGTTGRGGAVILSATDNSYTGKTTVQMGTLSIASLANVSGGNSSLGAPTSTANGTIDLGSGTSTSALRYTGSGHSSNRVINLAGTTGGGGIEANGSGALELTGANTAAAGAKTFTLTGTSTAANAIGVIAGTDVGVNKTGSGLWRLTGASSYGGQLTVSDGTLVVAAAVSSSGNSPFGSQTTSNMLPIIGSSAAGLSGTAALLVEGGLNIDRGFSVAARGSGASQVVVLGMAGTGSSLFSNGITLGRGVTLQASNSGTAGFSNEWINASSPVAFTFGSEGNAGVVELISALPESTGVNIVRGTARLAFEDNRINSATPVTIGSSLGSATLDINGQSQTLSNLSFAGNSGSITGGTLRLNPSQAVAVSGTGHVISSLVALDAAASFNVNAASRLRISSAISEAGGARSLTKTGAGILELAGLNTYTGDTAVSAGTLVVNGSLGAGNLSVAAGATLMGSGTVGGAATIAGIHSPGNSPGIETFSSNLTYSGGSSQVVWELWGNTDTNALDYDQIIVNGNLDFAGATNLSLDFGGSGFGSVDWDDVFWASPQTWTLFDVTGTTSNFGNFALTQSPNSWFDASGQAFASSSRAANTFTVGQDGSDVLIQYTVVIPEPGSLVLAAIGIAAAAYAARSRSPSRKRAG